jgi:hypothetical protein
VEEVEALVVGKQRVCAVFEQEVDDVVVTSLGCPEDGCCDGVPSFGIDVCAALD